MLKINNLTKTYPSFSLKNVSFEVKPGTIMGFIGRNGAGKTTTLKSLMNLITYDQGEIRIFDKLINEDELNIKQDIGFSLCDINYYMDKTLKQLTNVTKRFYPNWNQELYQKLCNNFNLLENKKVNELSNGMKVKYQLAVALSHNAKLLILDEPTSGLDPISRDEIVSIFEQFVKGGNRSILFSTHITSDLDKCADTITYINNGLIKFTGKKIDLINKYLMVSGKNLPDNLKDKCIGYYQHNNQFECLIDVKNKSLFSSFDLKTPTLEQIMVCLERKDNESITL